MKKSGISKIIFPIIAVLMASTSYASWMIIDCPRPNLVVQGPYENPSRKVDTSPEALKNLNKHYWFAYYTNSRWNNWSGVDEDNHFYLVTSVTKNEGNFIYGGTQLVKRFELPSSAIADASKVRVSFDVMKVIPIGFDVSLKPWEPSLIDSQLMGGDNRALQGNTVFNFSIISLATGNTILSDKGMNWHHSGIDYDRTTVSFILEGEDLYGGGLGYAMIVEAVYDGEGESNMDCYVFENTKIEKLTEVIPEPSVTFLMLAALGVGMTVRHRKTRFGAAASMESNRR